MTYTRSTKKSTTKSQKKVVNSKDAEAEDPTPINSITNNDDNMSEENPVLDSSATPTSENPREIQEEATNGESISTDDSATKQGKQPRISTSDVTQENSTTSDKTEIPIPENLTLPADFKNFFQQTMNLATTYNLSQTSRIKKLQQEWEKVPQTTQNLVKDLLSEKAFKATFEKKLKDWMNVRNILLFFTQLFV